MASITPIVEVILGLLGSSCEQLDKRIEGTVVHHLDQQQVEVKCQKWGAKDRSGAEDRRPGASDYC